MNFDEIEEQIPEVESYSGVDYYPYGDPYLSRFNGERVWVVNIQKEEAYHKNMDAGDNETIDDLCLSARRLIEEATIEGL
jgi:coproporphyrinogen III oxidase-like Fe-S oxidoreductase